MAGRDKVIWAATAIHLAIAAFYGLHVRLEFHIPQPIERVLAIYGGFTGVRARFDFFAPEVPSEARADFLIIPADGPPRQVRFAATPSGEANRRMALMFTVYAYPTERERLLRAWGEYMLRLHPDAVEVVSRVEMLTIPTISDGAAGKRATWAEVGRATVRRGAVPGR